MADFTGVSLPPLVYPTTSGTAALSGISFPPLLYPTTGSYVVVTTRPTTGQLYPRGVK